MQASVLMAGDAGYQNSKISRRVEPLMLLATSEHVEVTASQSRRLLVDFEEYREVNELISKVVSSDILIAQAKDSTT